MVDTTNSNDADASKEVGNESTKQDETNNKDVDANKQLQELKDKLAKTEEVLAKARRGERDNQSRRKELEAELAALKNDDETNDLKTKYDATVAELSEVRSALQNTASSALISTPTPPAATGAHHLCLTATGTRSTKKWLNTTSPQ